MNNDGVFRRRRLPHWDVEGKPIFITGCLEGSLSAAGLSKINTFRDELDTRKCPPNFTSDEWEHHKRKLLFGFVDGLLDNESPVHSLDDDRQAKIVVDAFLYFAGERYQLYAFVVMPSHHHWVFLPDPDWSLKAVQESKRKGGKPPTSREIISHSVQSYTGTVCNRECGTKGSYWQMETFDHWVRTEEELIKIIHYIESNPVKAGLVEKPEDYPWSSAKLLANYGVKLGDPIPVA